jgi:hypothetical protein
MPTVSRKSSSRAPYQTSDEETMQRLTCELAEQLQRDFKDRDRLYADIDATLFANFPIEIPEAYRKTAIEVRAPLALHIAQNVSAALSVNAPKVSFKPVGFGDVYQENSTRRERFFEASWKRQEQEARRQLFRLFMWSLAVKGEAILKTCERQAVWNTYADDAESYQQELAKDGLDQHAQDLAYDKHTENLKLTLPYPIATTDVPPECFYYTKNENGLTSVVEIKEVPYLEALERFGAGMDSSGNVVSPDNWSGIDPRAAQLARAEWTRTMKSSGSNTLRCIEAWDDQVQVICLQGPNQRARGMDKATLCKVTQHSYGDEHLHTLRGPYFHALGITTASRLPEHAGLSVLFGYLQLFRLIDSLLTVQGNAAFLTGFPTWKQTQAPGAIPGLPNPPYGSDGREEAAAQRLEPGKLYPFDIAPIDQPQSGADAGKLLQNIQQLVERAMPAAFSGAVGADQSGYALNQAAYLAGLAFNPIVSNAEVTMGDRTGFESWLIQNRIGETVYAWGEQEGKQGGRGAGQVKGSWLKIGPDDLDGVHRYNIKLSPSTPSNEIIQIRSIGEKMQLKLIPYEEAVEEAGYNPDEVEQSWLLHDLKQSPEIQQALHDAVFQKLGTIQAKQLQQPGQPSMAEMAGLSPQPPGAQGPPTGMPGTPGTPPSGPIGGMPPNPVPSPGQGLPIAPPPPGVGPGMPPGGIPGGGVVPNPPPNSLPLLPGGR